jgi:hypothetical protein
VSITREQQELLGDPDRTRDSCFGSFYRWAHGTFDFNRSHWDNGWGVNAPCDDRRPYTMSMNAIADLLINARGKSSVDRRVDPLIDWAVYYAGQQYDDFRAACQRGATIARYFGRVGTDRIRHYAPSWYSGIRPNWDGGRTLINAVSARGSIFVHEARHAHKGHNGNGNCVNGASCDKRFSYMGPNTYQVLYLEAYLNRTSLNTRAQRVIARNLALTWLRNFFNDPPNRMLPVVL